VPGGERLEAIARRLERRGLSACLGRSSHEHRARSDETQQSNVDQDDRDEDFDESKALPRRRNVASVLAHVREAATFAACTDTEFNRSESKSRAA
jgi:hypothetical protein